MRICRVSRSFPPTMGGLERHVELLSRHQARRGDTVWVLQPIDEGVPESGLTLIRVALGPLYRRIYAGRIAAKITTTVFAVRAVMIARRLHRNHPFDLIHVHGDILETLVLALWSWFSRVPVILTLHSGLNRRPLYRSLAASVFRCIDGVIAVSPEIREDLLSVGVKADRIAVIPSGVDTGRFCPPTAEERKVARATLGLRDSEMAVISVGRLHPVKGYDELIRSVANLGPTAPLRIILVGNGPEEQPLRQQARGFPNVLLVGRVDSGEIIRYLHAADVFVLPSVDLPGMREGTPTALLEAMACGLPVVCADAGGIRHVVRDAENGLLVPQRDAASLSSAFLKLLDQPQLRRLFGERNAALAREREWRKVAEQVTGFYEQIRKMKAMRTRAAIWNQ